MINNTPRPPDAPVVPAPGGAGAGRGASGGVAGDSERGTGGGGAALVAALAGPPVRTSSERWNQKNAEAGVKSLPSKGESFRSSRRKSRSSGRPYKYRKPRGPSGVPDSKVADISLNERGEVTQSASHVCDSSDESYGGTSCRTAAVASSSSFALSALSGSDRDDLIDFVVNTVTTSHMCTSVDYLSELTLSESTVRVPGGKVLRAIGTGNFYCSAVDQEGNPWSFVLIDVLCVPDLGMNLLSVGKLVQNGYDISFKEFHAHLSVGKTKSYFARGMDGRLVWPLEPHRTETKLRRRNGKRAVSIENQSSARDMDPSVLAQERRNTPVVEEALLRSPDRRSARSKPVGPQVVRHADQEPMGGEPHEQVRVSPEDVHAVQGLPDMIPVVPVVVPEEVIKTLERSDVIASELVPVRISDEVHAEVAESSYEAPQWERKSSRLYLCLLLLMIGMNFLLVSKLYEKGTTVASHRHEDPFISVGSGRTGLVHSDGSLYRWFVKPLDVGLSEGKKELLVEILRDCSVRDDVRASERVLVVRPDEGPEPVVVEPVISVGVIEPTEVVAEPVGVVRPNAYPKDRVPGVASPVEAISGPEECDQGYGRVSQGAWEIKNTTRTFEPFDRGKALEQDRRDLIRRSAMGSKDRGQRFEDIMNADEVKHHGKDRPGMRYGRCKEAYEEL